MENNKSMHLGHVLLEGFSKNPELIFQIDAATGQSETAASVVQRSTKVARCLRKYGLRPGDVLALAGKNHLDLRIPYYAAIYNGLPVAAVDPHYKEGEIKIFLSKSRPKIAFVGQETYDVMAKVATSLGLKMKLVTFEDGEHSLKRFIEEYQDDDKDEFRPADIDPEQVPAFLISTSGTSGMPKLATIVHANAVKSTQLFLNMFKYSVEGGISAGSTYLNLSPAQWISGYFYTFIMPLLGVTIVQSSGPATPEHYADMINKYKPMFSMFIPNTLTAILGCGVPVDLTCYKFLMLTGAKVYPELIQELRSRTSAKVVEGYGQTETLGMVLKGSPDGPPGNCGQDVGVPIIKVKLVDPETEQEITELRTPGELYVKNIGFSGYYNSPEETAAAFSSDGFYKTGDIMYRDENNYYFFVEKSKFVIKYKGYSLHPTELETIIATHPDVVEVGVTSVEDRSCGELPVACVVRRGSVGEAEIRRMVAERLSEAKHLHGGVLFVESLPHTSTGKVARGQLRDMVRAMKMHTENKL